MWTMLTLLGIPIPMSLRVHLIGKRKCIRIDNITYILFSTFACYVEISFLVHLANYALIIHVHRNIKMRLVPDIGQRSSLNISSVN